MNFNTDSDKRIRVDVRVRGESSSCEGHEWAYVQMWDKDEVALLLQANMRKSKQDTQSLLRSYERFHVVVDIKPGVIAGNSNAGLDEVLAKAE